MSGNEHICTRMVAVIEEKGLSVAKFEQTASEAGVKVSGGYLRKAAKNDTDIGVELVEYFLGQFPHVSREWLMTGKGNRVVSEINGTHGDKQQPVQDYSWLGPVAKLQSDIKELQKAAEDFRGRIEALEKGKPAKPAPLQKAKG